MTYARIEVSPLKRAASPAESAHGSARRLCSFSRGVGPYNTHSIGINMYIYRFKYLVLSFLVTFGNFLLYSILYA